MDDKKKKELEIVHFLKKRISFFPPGEIIPFEKPDFIIKYNSYIHGIEVTQLHKNLEIDNPESKANESSRKIIIKSIEEKLDKRNIKNLTITIIFSNTNHAFKVNREDISNRIVNIIAENIPDSKLSIDISNSDKFEHNLPYEIDTISIRNLKNEKSVIIHPIAGWVQEDFISELQHRISLKNNKLPHYLINCSQCWLVIYSTWDDASTFLDPSSKTISNKYNSAFSKIFYVGGMPRKSYELFKN